MKAVRATPDGRVGRAVDTTTAAVVMPVKAANDTAVAPPAQQSANRPAGIDPDLLRNLVAEAVQQALAGGPIGCNRPGQFSDSRIATDGGSSATQEESIMFEKLYGPYLNRGRFLVHLHQLDGIKQYRTFTTEDDARSFMLANQARVLSSPVTVKAAVGEYVEQRKDLRESSRTTQRFRLEALIRGRETVVVQAFPAMAAWEQLAKVSAVDTLHGVRSAANGFFAWCILKRYMKKNPLEGVEIIGAKKCGKEQLRLDEARSFLDRAIAVLDGQPLEGRGGSQQRVAVVGAATALLLGARNGEVVSRVVRDLDDEGRVFWIPQAKTKAGVRRVEVPEALRPYLVALAAGRPATAQLFDGLTADGLRYWTAKLCKELGVPRVTVHGLRGTHATASMRPHANPQAVAAALGHDSFTVTQRHYAKQEAIDSARQTAAEDALLANRVAKKVAKTFGHPDGVADPNPEPPT